MGGTIISGLRFLVAGWQPPRFFTPRRNARPARRARNVERRSSSARLAHQLDHLGGCRATDDRVVDDDEALALDDLPHRVELQVYTLVAHALVRLDEGAADVAVLDETFRIRDAGLMRVPDRGRRGGVRHANN